MTTGTDIFWRNAHVVLRDIGMQSLDPVHGAAVDIVRWCRVVRGRPTHHRQALLEQVSPALLVYLEALANSGGPAAWRTLEERIRVHAETLRDSDVRRCSRPWLAAIWHALPELVGLGQHILDRLGEKEGSTSDAMSAGAGTATGAGSDGNTESAGKAGSAATANRPGLLPCLVLPIVAVTPTPAEAKALGFRVAREEATSKKDVTPEGPGTGDGSEEPKPPGGLR